MISSSVHVMYLGHVFSHCVVVESSFGPELFVALLALQGVLELQGWKANPRIK